MKNLLLLLIIPFLSFGQNQDCEYQELEGFTYGGYFQGSHYYISEGTSTWIQANDNINLLGIGHFVSITSEEENNFIVETFSESTPSVWIGLYQNCPDNWIDINTGACLNSNNGTYNAEEVEIWEWLSGETLVYQNWEEGCPGCGSNEDIALLYTIDYAGTPSGEWNDGLINGGNPYASILEVECYTQTNAEDEENNNTNTEAGPGDNNGDGVVNLQDLFAVLDNWLETYTYSDNMTENQIDATLDSVISIISTLLPEGTNIGEMLVWDGDNWGLIEPGNTGDILTISDGGLPIWNNLTSDSTFLTNLSSSVQPAYLSLGDDYQGGKVAYIFQEGDPGYIEGEQHGIIAAPNDLNQNALALASFGCYETELGGTSTEIGTAVLNTYNLISNDNTGCLDEFSAATQCFNLELNGYDDWVLPSSGDLMKLYISRNIVGGYSTGYDEDEEYIDWQYASSSEDGGCCYYVVFFANGWGESYLNTKSSTSDLIRPIRYF